MNTPDTQRAVVLAVVDAILSTVETAGSLGAPASVLCVGLMAHGMTLPRCEEFLRALVEVGKLRKEGQLYFIPDPR